MVARCTCWTIASRLRNSYEPPAATVCGWCGPLPGRFANRLNTVTLHARQPCPPWQVGCLGHGEAEPPSWWTQRATCGQSAAAHSIRDLSVGNPSVSAARAECPRANSTASPKRPLDRHRKFLEIARRTCGTSGKAGSPGADALRSSTAVGLIPKRGVAAYAAFRLRMAARLG